MELEKLQEVIANVLSVDPKEQMQVMKHGAFGGEIVFSCMMSIPEE